MKISGDRKLLIWVTLSLLFVFMLGTKSLAATEFKLLASDGAAGDEFGQSVSISGNVALVGAPGSDDKGTDSGKAYVFRWNGSNWVEEQKLLASGGATIDHFGTSVSIDGDVALVGADEDEDDDGKEGGPGSAYVFRWNGSSWVEEQKLLASDGASGEMFGTSVSISENVALVGAVNEGSNTQEGKAYVFRWNGSSWVEEQKLLASDGAAGAVFGVSVSISGNVALVGATEEEKFPLGSGKAYVFRWNGSNWVQEQRLLSSDGASGDEFGGSVSIDGDVALVGADSDDDEKGSAYVFRWNGSNWVEEQKLLASDGATEDEFGSSVSISGNVALVGAIEEEKTVHSSGKAYVFRWNGSNWVEEQKLLASDGASGAVFGVSVSISGNLALIGASEDEKIVPGPGKAYIYALEVPASEIIGTWDSGIWYWDVASSKWTQMTSSTPTGDIAAGDFTGDGKADVASIWTNGLWYQDGATLDWTKVGSAPNSLTAGDVTGDDRAEIIGAWDNGIWYWDVAESKWIKMASSTPTGDIAAGDFTGDGKADVASIWASGLWYQDGANLTWTKISGTAPDSVTSGDVTGDGRSEIIGTWSSGIWYYDVAASKWTQMTSGTPDGDIAAGDFTGDNKADVASCWSNGLWYQDGSTLGWTKISDSAPVNLTAGDVTGN